MDNIDYDWILSTTIEEFGEDYTDEQLQEVFEDYMRAGE